MHFFRDCGVSAVLESSGITYTLRFCARCFLALTKKLLFLAGAPKLDQHAAHETNRAGNPICPRLGTAANFIVHAEDMLEVAEWIASNTRFDRLYFYGKDLPVHVSVGPDHSRSFIHVRTLTNGRRHPLARRSVNR